MLLVVMPTEKQITALLVLAGSAIALAFAAFNVYLVFKNSNNVSAVKKG